MQHIRNHKPFPISPSIFLITLSSFAEYLSKPEDRVFWKAHGLPDDDLCIENAVILERCGRYPLMVDPSDQGTSFLQSALSGQKLVKSSLVDDSFIKHLESAMRFGTPLLITDVESIDQVNLARHFFSSL